MRIKNLIGKLFSNGNCSPVEQEIRRRVTWRIILLSLFPLPFVLSLILSLYCLIHLNTESIDVLLGQDCKIISKLCVIENELHKVAVITNTFDTAIGGSAGGKGGVKVLVNHVQQSSSSDHVVANDVTSDESITFNTIDSILLQAILYSKVKGCYPDFSLIEIPIHTLVKKGCPADQYGRAIHYSVTNDVLDVRSAGRDGLFETDDDIIGTASLNQTGRHIKGKYGTFDYEVEW